MRLNIVTSIEDSGFNEPAPEGSLRQAVDRGGLIVFAVSGEIVLKKDLILEQSDTHIIGQSAPWPGITLRGATVRMGGAASRQSVEHLAIYPWPRSPHARPDITRCVSIESFPSTHVSDFLVANCALGFGSDECLTLWNRGAGSSMDNVVLRDNLIFHAVVDAGHEKGSHNYGVLIGADSGEVFFQRNIVAHCAKRMPAIQANTFAWVTENVFYNFSTEGLFANDEKGPLTAHVWNNWFIAGRDSKIQGPMRAPHGMRFKLRHYESALSLINNEMDDCVTWWEELNDAVLDDNASVPPTNWVTPTRRLEKVLAISAGPKFTDAVQDRVKRDVVRREGGILLDPEDELHMLRRVRRNPTSNVHHHPVFSTYDESSSEFRNSSGELSWRSWVREHFGD